MGAADEKAAVLRGSTYPYKLSSNPRRLLHMETLKLREDCLVTYLTVNGFTFLMLGFIHDALPSSLSLLIYMVNRCTGLASREKARERERIYLNLFHYFFRQGVKGVREAERCDRRGGGAEEGKRVEGKE